MGKYEIQIPKQKILDKGYYVDTIGKNTERIKEYIKNQLEEDKTIKQLCIAEAFDPFEKYSK